MPAASRPVRRAALRSCGQPGLPPRCCGALPAQHLAQQGEPLGDPGAHHDVPGADVDSAAPRQIPGQSLPQGCRAGGLPVVQPGGRETAHGLLQGAARRCGGTPPGSAGPVRSRSRPAAGRRRAGTGTSWTATTVPPPARARRYRLGAELQVGFHDPPRAAKLAGQHPGGREPGPRREPAAAHSRPQRVFPAAYRWPSGDPLRGSALNCRCRAPRRGVTRPGLIRADPQDRSIGTLPRSLPPGHLARGCSATC